jgi:hypothetical protein
MKFPFFKVVHFYRPILVISLILFCFGLSIKSVAQGGGGGNGGGGGGGPFPPCELDSLIISQPTCFGGCNAEISLFATCGPVLHYLWNEAPGINLPTLSGICEGVYHYTVTDSGRCTIIDSVVIEAPPQISFSVIAQGTSCPGGCTGFVTVVPSDTLPYSFYWPGYMASGPVLGTLCQGTYSVIVTNEFGCTRIETADVGYIPPFQLSFSSTPSSCLASCNGSAFVTANGTPPFIYQWLTGPIQTTQTAYNLCEGIYLANVTDSIGCTVTDSVYINQLAPKTVDVVAINPTCFGGCNGTATASIQSAGNYSYFWDTSPPQFSATATGLCTGNYLVNVTDLQTGCQYFETAVITDPTPPNLTFNVTSSYCNNVCNGQIEAILNNNDPATFLWSNGNNVQVNSSLCPGVYAVTVTDTLGCITSASAAVGSEPLTIFSSNATCNNICDGFAGLLLPFASEWFIDWTTVPVQHSPVITDLCAGVYSVAIVDTSGCELNGFVEVLSSEPIVAFSNISAISCAGDCDGSIEFSVTGNEPFQFIWNSLPQFTGDSAINLCSGMYSVTITDSIGCVLQDSIVVDDPIPVVINYFTVPNSCSQVCDAVIEAIPASTNIYNFQWQTNPIQTGSIATGLCPGFNYVEVTNSDGCVRMDSIMIIDTSPLNINFNATDISCAGICDGFIASQAWGGHPSFSYQWSNGSQNPQILNLCAGTYTVTVTDVYGCTGSSAKQISEPSPLNVGYTLTSATCAICNDGSIDVNITGGTEPYIVVLSPGGVTGTSIQNLLPGLYSLCVVDHNNCSWCEDVFIADITGLNDYPSTLNNLNVYPNPFSKTTYLELPVVDNLAFGKVDFVVVDVSGRRVSGFEFNKKNSVSNNPVFEIENHNASDGIYFFKIIVDNRKYFSGKLVVCSSKNFK